MNWDRIEESFENWIKDQIPIVTQNDIDDDELDDLLEDVIDDFIKEMHYKNPEKMFDELINWDSIRNAVYEWLSKEGISLPSDREEVEG